MDLREEFVLRAKAPGACIAALCREFGVSRKTGYKWLARFDAEGVEALADMSRRPRRVVETSGGCCGSKSSALPILAGAQRSSASSWLGACRSRKSRA